MNKRIRNRLLATVVVTLFSVYLFAGFPPSLANVRERVRLGLDLRGGTHLVLQVVTDDAIRAERDLAIENIRQLLQRDTITFRQITPAEAAQFQVVGVDTNRDQDFRRVLNERLPEWQIASTAGEIPNTYTLRLNPAQEQNHTQSYRPAWSWGSHDPGAWRPRSA
jgi:preprotein translocase subunit SecD